jgi:ADP-heptose:LPS heptosyltransferase
MSHADKFHQILFVELLGGLGDVLIALPAIAALANSHPQAQLTVLTFAPGNQLLQHHPLIHQVIEVKQGEARQAVDQALKAQSFDLIVSDTNYDGIAEAIQNSGAKWTVTNLWRDPPDHQRVGDRFLNILIEEGVIAANAMRLDQPLLHLTAAEHESAHQALGAAYRPLIVLCPDAGMPVKRWSTANFVQLGRALQQRYGATILIPVGADQEQAEQIAQQIGGTAQIWQRGSLRQLAAVMSEADLVIASDTGPARIAAALNVPTVTLFGPSWHGRYGQPFPHINLQGYPECPERNIQNFTEQRCWYSGVCPFDQWDSCMQAIAPAEVLAAVERVWEQKSMEAREQSLKPKIQNLKLNFENSLSVDWRNVRNLLVMRLDNIGDVIMTSPALRAIKQNLPAAKLTLMASPSGAMTAPLLPWVDEVLPWRVLWQDLGRLPFDPEREWELVKFLSDRHFDAAIIFTSFSQSPHPAALICHLAGIPLRLGESKEKGLGFLTHELDSAPDEIHQVERNLRLVESVGFEVSDRRLAIQTSKFKIQNSEFKLPREFILLNPWTTCQSRNYDPGRFAAAARRLSEITKWSVVVTGVEKDRDRAFPLLQALGNCAIDLIGKTSLSELADLVAEAQLVLTNNTSTMHIADATQTPMVVLFAGTERESQWCPRHAPIRLLRRPTVCSPCYAFTCPYSLECLDIPPETVVAAALELLRETNAVVTALR